MIKTKTSSVLLIVSAPSGAGKTTLCNRLLREDSGIQYSVSCTTRPPREGEVDGTHYHFMNNEEFDRHVQQGEFLEFAEVHGCKYGTLKAHVCNMLSDGLDVLMDLDVQGAEQLRNNFRSQKKMFDCSICYADVFISPPSLEVLESRLRSRGLDQEGVIRVRLENAVEEMKHSSSFNYLILNDDLDDSFDALQSILTAERCRNGSHL